MKRVLNGVHLLFAIGLVFALAACTGSDSSIKRERDQAQAAAEAAEAARMQAEADKAAAEAAAAQAEADKMAAEQAAAQAEADKIAAEVAAEEAEAEKMRLEEELAGVAKTIPELQAAVDMAVTDLAAAQAASDTADMEYEAAKMARMEAQTAVNESEPEGLADAIAALQEARTAETAAMEAAMMAKEAADAAQMALDYARDALAAADTGPSAGALADQATAKTRVAFDVVDSTVPASNTVADVTRRAGDNIKVSNDGTVVKWSSTAVSNPLTQADENKSPMIDGWRSGTLTEKRGGDKTVGMAYSNIEDPKDELFAVVYGGRKTGVTVAEDSTATPPITADGAASMTTANWKKVRIPIANAYGGGTTGGSVAGTYDGAAGTFTCTGTECPTVTGATAFPARKSNGAIATRPTGVWSFTATDKGATVKAADSDYLTFGYWLSKDDTGTPQLFRVWYNGHGSKSATASAAALLALDEKVTYTGAAAGKYVTKNDIANTASAGYFTADAELTAEFRDSVSDVESAAVGDVSIDIDGTSTAGTVAGTLKGTISGFKDGDSAPLGDLKLSLSGQLWNNDAAGMLTVRTDIYDHDGDTGQTDATPDQRSNTVSGTSGGAKANVQGAWEAQMFGTQKNTNLPTGVAGAFSANIGNGQAAVSGGFGATKD